MTGPQRETPKIDRPRRKADPQEWVSKPKVGDLLGSFRLLQLLGEGGAGVVYRAEHSFLKRPVAIKVLHPELYLRPAMVARFFQEALAVNRARHRNIIDITDVVASEGQPPFIVMELLVGEDLGDAIDRRGPLPLRFTLHVAKQICAALAVVHRLGIVHRDLKPENIFLVASGEEGGADTPTVKLLDFGIAKFLDNEENRRRTWSGNVLGTPAYMPLEQLHGLPVDHRADIYALGVVFYEMLTGRLPFEIDSLDDISSGVLLTEPLPPSKKCPGRASEPFPKVLDDLVLRCLADSPARRFQSVEDLAEAVAQSLISLDGMAHPGAPAGSEAIPSLDSNSSQGSSNVPSLPNRQEPEPGEKPTPLAKPATVDDSIPRIPTPPAPDAAETLRQPRRFHGRALLGGGVLLVIVLGGLGALRLIFPKDAHQRSSSASSWATESQFPTDMKHPHTGQPGSVQTIALTSEPTQAQVFLADTGALLGETPAKVPINGHTERVLLVRHAGFQETRVILEPGKPGPVHVRLDPLAPPPIPDAGVLGESKAADTAPQVRARSVQVPAPRVRETAPPVARPRVTEQGIVDPFDK